MEPEEFFEAIENETIEENKNTPSDNNAQD